MKKAFITGVTGQDGAYLSEFLLKKWILQAEESEDWIIATGSSKNH